MGVRTSSDALLFLSDAVLTQALRLVAADIRWREVASPGDAHRMTLRVQCLDIDAADPKRLASFWAQALGWRCTFETPEEVVLEPPAGSPDDGVVPDLLFLQTPDDRVVKNRLHLDLRPDDQAVEVARLEALGARRMSIGQPVSVSWVVMADPEGNEFCVLRAFTPDEAREIALERRNHDGDGDDG